MYTMHVENFCGDTYSFLILFLVFILLILRVPRKYFSNT